MSNANYHTCEKAAPGWQNDTKPCGQCVSDARLANLFEKLPPICTCIHIRRKGYDRSRCSLHRSKEK